MDNDLSPTEIAQLCIRSLEEARPYLTRDVIVALKDQVNEQSYSDPEHALEIAEIALKAAAMLQDEVADAWATWAKGIALNFCQYLQDALPFYRQAESIFNKHEQWLSLSYLQAGLVYVLIRCGDPESALALAELVRPRCIQLGEAGLKPLGLLEMNVGTLYSEQGKFGQALTANERAMSAYAALHAEFDIARIKINSANAYKDMDQYQQAEILYNEAHQLLQRVAPERQELCIVDFNLGLLAQKLGDYQKALHHFERARDGFIPDAHIALVDMNRAEIYNTLNLSQDALILAQNAAKFYREADIPNDLAQALRAQAVAWQQLNQPEMAHHCLLEARQYFAAHNSYHDIALIDLTLAELALEHHDLDSASQLSRNLSDIIDGDLWPNLAGKTYLLQARILLYALQKEETFSEKKLHSAYRALKLTLLFTEGHPEPRLMIGVYHLLSQLHCLQHKTQNAWYALCQAIAYLEKLRSNLLLDEFRIGFMDEQNALYLDGVQLLQQEVLANSALDSKLYLARILYLLDLAATAPLAQSHTNANIDPALNDELQHLRALWHWQQAKLDEAQSTAEDIGDEPRQRIAEMVASLAETESQIADLGRRLGVRSSWQEMAESTLTHDIKASARSGPILAKQFQDQADQFLQQIQQRLETGEGLLHYFVVDQDIYLLFLTADKLCYEQLGPVTSVHKFQQNWTHHLQDTQLIVDMPQIASKVANRMLSALGQVLVEPISSLLAESTNHIYLIYPADWHEIPFAALCLEDCYLIERFQITHLSTPSALLRHASCTNHDGIPTPLSEYQQPHALILGYSEAGALPHNLQEACLVEQTLSSSGWETTLLLEEAANLASLNQAFQKCRLLHLATHALFQPENPLFSWIRLADSQLTVADLYHRTPLLNQPLVLLSACETGRGQVRGGGLLGMARALLVSGAKSLVVSLWRVEDQATAQLMASFYEQMNSQKPLTSDLLCNAQRRLAIAQHPFFWAGFIYIGG